LATLSTASGSVFSLEPTTSASHGSDKWRGRTSTCDRQGAQLHWERTGPVQQAARNTRR